MHKMGDDGGIDTPMKGAKDSKVTVIDQKHQSRIPMTLQIQVHTIVIHMHGRVLWEIQVTHRIAI